MPAPPRREPVRSAVVVSCLLFGAVAGSVGGGCGDEETPCPPLVLDSDVECDTTQDCVDEGFTTLRCVNRVCRRPCVSDGDCELRPTPECSPEGGLPAAICEDQICMTACPDVPCPMGLECHAGQCVVAFEDFEIRAGEQMGSLPGFGWNQVPSGDRLENPTMRLVRTGRAGCNLGDDDCAGVAASGEQYVIIGTQPTSEKGTATLGPTCRPCACCLECQVNPYPEGVGLDACPRRAFVPAPLTCPMDVPPTCASVCAACEQCALAADQRGSDPSLVSCEATAAARTCPSCPQCDGAACRDCRQGACLAECEADPDADACRVCEATECPTCLECRACEVCGEAVNCGQVDPDEASCRRKRLECDTLGADGCYPTPIRYDRSELTPLEQSLVSPELDLSGRSGSLRLSFAYVPFGVGSTYFRSQQGVPASMWLRETQEVVVELCGGSCEDPSSWQVAERVQGGEARFPPEGRRSNGLSVGKQSEVDWRSGRVEVFIPEALRTSAFRVRFQPRLAPEARVGIDDLRVRSGP